MFRAIRPFFITLPWVWLALFAAAFLLLRQHEHAFWIISAFLPACAVEFPLYLATMLEPSRASAKQWQRPKVIGLYLWVSALVPYLLFSLGGRTFHLHSFGLLAGLFGVLALWYVIVPHHWISDVGFLILAAVPVASHIFAHIYVSPDPNVHLSVDILGHLAWIRVAVAAILILRGWNPGAFGLWPNGREWAVGTVFFLAAILPVAFAAVALKLYQFTPGHASSWAAVATAAAQFFGILWVVALSEELFFRGVIERALLDVERSPLLAILVSAVLYGCSHLWFRRFPNWQDAVVTTILGIACGMVYAATGSVRTSMVTHSLTVAAAALFFRAR